MSFLCFNLKKIEILRQERIQTTRLCPQGKRTFVTRMTLLTIFLRPLTSTSVPETLVRVFVYGPRF